MRIRKASPARSPSPWLSRHCNFLLLNGCLRISRWEPGGPRLPLLFFFSLSSLSSTTVHQVCNPCFTIYHIQNILPALSLYGSFEHCSYHQVFRSLLPFETSNLAITNQPPSPKKEAPQPVRVPVLSIKIPEHLRPPPEAAFVRRPLKIGPEEALADLARNSRSQTRTSDPTIPHHEVLTPGSSATKPKVKYSSRITFLSSTIQDFTALRDKLLKLSRPLKSKDRDTIIDELQALIETQVKSKLIDFLWESRMRLNTM